MIHWVESDKVCIKYDDHTWYHDELSYTLRYIENDKKYGPYSKELLNELRSRYIKIFYK